jgi:hypothetical protein
LITRTPNAQSLTRLLTSIYRPILADAIPELDTTLTTNRATKRRKTPSTPEDPREKVQGILEKHASEDEERLRRVVLSALPREAGMADESGVRDVIRRKVYAFVRHRGDADDEDD